ncbi:P-loop containing nucleoside triphosphate hydrolase protein [Sparassis latifolia]
MSEPSPSSSSREDPKPKPVLIIVMGVAGTGKTTLAHALSELLRLPYVEGDALHPPANIAKMSAGHPLDDADREPWLARLRTTAERIVAQQQQQAGLAPAVPSSHCASIAPPPAPSSSPPPPLRPGVLVTCSALKASYRSILRGTARPPHGALPDAPAPAPALATYFVYIRGDRALLLERVARRRGHYMKANMVDSQLGALESPEGEEGVVVVDMTDATEVQVAKVLEAFEGVISPAA